LLPPRCMVTEFKVPKEIFAFASQVVTPSVVTVSRNIESGSGQQENANGECGSLQAPSVGSRELGRVHPPTTTKAEGRLTVDPGRTRAKSGGHSDHTRAAGRLRNRSPTRMLTGRSTRRTSSPNVRTSRSQAVSNASRHDHRSRSRTTTERMKASSPSDSSSGFSSQPPPLSKQPCQAATSSKSSRGRAPTQKGVYQHPVSSGIATAQRMRRRSRSRLRLLRNTQDHPGTELKTQRQRREP
jgi:hypothetical protein